MANGDSISTIIRQGIVLRAFERRNSLELVIGGSRKEEIIEIFKSIGPDEEHLKRVQEKILGQRLAFTYEHRIKNGMGTTYYRIEILSGRYSGQVYTNFVFNL